MSEPAVTSFHLDTSAGGIPITLCACGRDPSRLANRSPKKKTTTTTKKTRRQQQATSRRKNR